jgi:hypothetical protein
MVPIIASAVATPFVFETVVPERLVTHAVQAVICLVTYIGTLLDPRGKRATVLGVLLICAINSSLFWSLSLSAEDMDIGVSVIGGVLLLAPAVFPWDRARRSSSVYSALGYLAVLPLPVLGATRLYHVGLSLVFAVTTSIVSAYMLDRHRRATFYERERVASLAHQRELLIDASRLLNGTLALPELVGLVTDLGRAAHGADAVALAPSIWPRSPSSRRRR